MTQNFDTAFATFLQGVKQIAANYDPTTRIEADVGPRYIRVVRVEPPNWDGDHEHRTLHCFVDRSNGQVLRGSWKQPRFTKQSRGNIFDANSGLGSMKRHSADY